MESLRIVLVMLEPPLPFGNAVGRWYYVLLKGLQARGHRVTAFATCGNPADAAAACELFRAPECDLRCYPVRTGGGWLSKWNTLRRPYSYLLSSDLQHDLCDRLNHDFDVLHLEGLWSGWAALPHVRRAVLNVHFLFSLDQPRLTGGLVNRLRQLVTRRAERSLLRQFPHLLAVTPQLAGQVARLTGTAATAIPLALDLDLYPFRPHSEHAGPPTVGLIGSFNWSPTCSAGRRLLTRLWPEIKRQLPSARLQLVGRQAQAAFPEFFGSPDVSFHSDVPDTLPYFRNTDVLVYAPEAGSGAKVKVLEAFALGTPVVTNGAGCEGIPAVDGVQAGISEDDRGLVARTVALLCDAQRRETQRLAARRLLEAQFSPAASLDRLEQAYRILLASQDSVAAFCQGTQRRRAEPVRAG